MNASRFLLPLLILAALYFVLIRPQRMRQRAAAQLTNSIAAGQRVVTTAGMYATIVEVDDNGVLLEIAPGVEVRYVRQAISRVVEDEYVPAVGGVEGEYAEDEYAPDDEYADDEQRDDDEDETDDKTTGTDDGTDAQPVAADRPRTGATAVDLSKDRPPTDRPGTDRPSTDLDPADQARR